MFCNMQNLTNAGRLLNLTPSSFRVKWCLLEKDIWTNKEGKTHDELALR